MSCCEICKKPVHSDTELTKPLYCTSSDYCGKWIHVRCINKLCDPNINASNFLCSFCFVKKNGYCNCKFVNSTYTCNSCPCTIILNKGCDPSLCKCVRFHCENGLNNNSICRKRKTSTFYTPESSTAESNLTSTKRKKNNNEAAVLLLNLSNQIPVSSLMKELNRIQHSRKILKDRFINVFGQKDQQLIEQCQRIEQFLFEHADYKNYKKLLMI